MKRLIAIFVTCFFSGSMAYFEDGNDLMDKMREWEKGMATVSGTDYTKAAGYSSYVTGIYDVLDLTEVVCAPNTNVTRGQINSIVANYLKQNPARWSQPAYFLVRDALDQAFPCR